MCSFVVLKNGKWQGWTSDTSMLANAGKVLVRIIGNAPENDNSKAGYYGSVEGTGLSDSDPLMYDIHPFDVSSCKIKFLLDGIIENNIFDVNCTREDIIERAYLVNGGTRYPIKDLGSENSGIGEYMDIMGMNEEELEDLQEQSRNRILL